MSTKIITCGCGKQKTVRVADIKRGWGKYCSKSCKAKDQNRRIRPDRNMTIIDDIEVDFNSHCLDTHPFSTEGIGQDGHGW